MEPTPPFILRYSGYFYCVPPQLALCSPIYDGACSPDNYTAILDLKSFAVIGQLDVDGRVWSEFLLSRLPVDSSTKTILVCSQWLEPLTRGAARHQKAPAAYAASA